MKLRDRHGKLRARHSAWVCSIHEWLPLALAMSKCYFKKNPGDVTHPLMWVHADMHVPTHQRTRFGFSLYTISHFGREKKRKKNIHTYTHTHTRDTHTHTHTYTHTHTHTHTHTKTQRTHTWPEKKTGSQKPIQVPLITTHTHKLISLGCGSNVQERCREFWTELPRGRNTYSFTY